MNTNCKLNQSPYHSPHRTPTYSPQMNPIPARIHSTRIRRDRSRSNTTNINVNTIANQHPIVYKMININDDSPPHTHRQTAQYPSTHYRNLSHHTRQHPHTSPQHYAQYSNASQIPPLHSFSSTNYHQTNSMHTNHTIHTHNNPANERHLVPRKRNSRRSLRKPNHLNTAYPFNTACATSNNRKSSKSISSVSSNNSAETTNTSAYTSTTCLSSPREAEHSNNMLHGPCDRDPFWDYYRTIGNISRANSFELIDVMKFISAEHIIKLFLQNWISSRIEPMDLPFAHHAISSKMQYTKRKRNKKKTSSIKQSVHNLSAQNVQQHNQGSHMHLKALTFNPMTRNMSTKSFTMSESGQYTFEFPKICSQHLNAVEDEDRDSDEDTTDSEQDEGFSAHAKEVILMHNTSSNRGKKSKFQIDSVPSSMEGGYVSYAYSSLAKGGIDNNINDINVNSSSLTKFIRQSLKVSDVSSQHPNYFHVPHVLKLYHKYYQDQDEEEEEWHKRDTLNEIGMNIFSYLDQVTFLNASIVSRSWFYCSRFERSRSQIMLRLVNVLRYLIKAKDLLNGITANNNIICIDELASQNTYNNESIDTDLEDTDSDSDDIEDKDDDEWMQNDILLSCITKTNELHFAENTFENTVNGNKQVQNSEQHITSNMNGTHLDETQNKDNNKPYTFAYFFASRVECGLFSSVAVLQIDLTIVSNNCLMYFIDDALYDCFWEMALTLFRIESLKSIDLILCDPHILLLSYILKNIKSLKISKSELKFPSIGIPKHKFLCISKVIESLSFKCRSLSALQLTKILNTHFEHYYYPLHHHKTMDVDYIRQQSTSFCYKSLESYILCRKTIQKPLLFDITHALYYLNRRPSGDVTTIQRFIMSDVRCSSYELEIFLNHNANSLTHLELQFSKYCVFDPNQSKMQMINSGNGSAPSLTSRSTFAHHTFDSTPSGKSAIEDHDDEEDEDTGFPDVSTLPQQSSKLQTSKSSTMLRIAAYLNEIFDAIVVYLNKSATRYREYNNRLRKKKKTKKRLSILPLNTLAVSFPNHLDDDCISGFFDLFKRLESQCDEIQITQLYLNGLCVIQPINSRKSNSKLNWMNIFQSQHIQNLYLRQFLYMDSFFESVPKLWSYSLLHLELSVSFELNSNPNAIKRLFVSLSKCHRLQHLSFEFVQNARRTLNSLRQYSSSHYGIEEPQAAAAQKRVRGTPLPQLPQSLASQHSCSNNNTPSAAEERERISISSNSYSHSRSHSHHHHHHQQHHFHHHAMEPILDIWWLHQFITSKNIKKSIQTLKVTFNELSTKKFENATNSTPKYTRWNQEHGQILRISDGFKVEVEQLIMSWFAHCPHLIECRMLRKLSTMDALDSFNQNEIINDDQIAINFDLDISCFDDDESYLDHLDKNDIHHLILFKIKKWKVDNVYKGDVTGELDKLLMPEIPIG